MQETNPNRKHYVIVETGPSLLKTSGHTLDTYIQKAMNISRMTPTGLDHQLP